VKSKRINNIFWLKEYDFYSNIKSNKDVKLETIDLGNIKDFEKIKRRKKEYKIIFKSDKK